MRRDESQLPIAHRTTPESSHMSLVSIGFAVILTVIFGGNAVAIKLALTGMGPLTAAGLRFVLAAAAIAGWAYFSGRPFRIRADQIFPLLLISMGFTIQLGLFYLGLERTYASRGVLISNLLPFFVLFLSHRFIPGERITAGKLWGILLGFSGVICMVAGENTFSGSVHSGDLLVLAAVTIWSGNVVFTKRIINDFMPFHLVLYPMIFSAPLFLSAGAAWDTAMVFDLNAVVIGAYVYQSLVSAAFGFVAWSTMLKRFGASTLHSFIFIMPISGVVFSGFILHEPITPNLIVAMTLIAAGILMVHRSPRWPSFTFPLGRGL